MFQPERTWLMGVVNVTPDSFSDGGHFVDPARAVEHGLTLVEQGADVLDVGGESTRPGADPVSVEQELERVIPVVRGLAARTDTLISIDTSKAAVASAALDAGAGMVNDVTGLRGDPEMAQVAARAQWLCAMHLRGTPRTMQDAPEYDDVVGDVAESLAGSVRLAVAAGMPRERVLVDPGIGFGKALEHNLALIHGIEALEIATGCPVLMGVSRKSFLGTLTGRPVGEREFGTAAAVTACVLAGARVVRVHDVSAMRDVVRVADALRRVWG